MAVQVIGSQPSEMVQAGLSMTVYRHLMSPLAVSDFLLIQEDTAAAPVINTPTGFAQYFATANGTTCKQSSFWKVGVQADLNPISHYAATFGASSTARATIHVFRGVDTTDPANFVRSSISGTSTAPGIAAGVTTPSPNCMVILMVGVVSNTDITAPAGFTEMQDSAALPGTTTIRGASFFKIFPNEGPTGAITASVSVSAGWVATVIVLPSTDYPAFRSASTATNTSATVRSIVVTKPTGAAPGDSFDVGVKVDSTTAIVTPPAMFILVSDTTSGTFRFLRFKKTIPSPLPAGYVEPSGYEFRRDTGGYISVHMLCYRSTFTTGEIFGATNAVATPSSTTHATALTTLWNNSRLVAFFAEAGDNAGTTLFTAPSGMTERTDVQLTGTADVLQATAGASGTKTATFTVTAVGVASLHELRARYTTPAPAGDGTYVYGTPEYYMPPAPAAMDATQIWGTPEYYFSAAAPPTTSMMMMLGVG